MTWKVAGGKTLYDALTETGRVATQGISFDTDSDPIRPEPTPTLKELSPRQAAAVKAYLVAKHGIDSSRLSSAGFGEGSAISYQLSAISYQLSAISYQLSRGYD